MPPERNPYDGKCEANASRSREAPSFNGWSLDGLCMADCEYLTQFPLATGVAFTSGAKVGDGPPARATNLLILKHGHAAKQRV